MQRTVNIFFNGLLKSGNLSSVADAFVKGRILLDEVLLESVCLASYFCNLIIVT